MHDEKQFSPIDFTLSGMIIVVNKKQLSKALLSIDLKFFGRVTLAKMLHLEKVYCLIVVTLSGMIISVNSLQYSNATIPIYVTLSGIRILENLPKLNALYPIDCKPSGRVMLVKLMHSENACSSIIKTPSGTE